MEMVILNICTMVLFTGLLIYFERRWYKMAKDTRDTLLLVCDDSVDYDKNDEMDRDEFNDHADLFRDDDDLDNEPVDETINDTWCDTCKHKCKGIHTPKCIGCSAQDLGNGKTSQPTKYETQEPDNDLFEMTLGGEPEQPDNNREYAPPAPQRGNCARCGRTQYPEPCAGLPCGATQCVFIPREPENQNEGPAVIAQSYDSQERV